jgi:hypothetical protein
MQTTPHATAHGVATCLVALVAAPCRGPSWPHWWASKPRHAGRTRAGPVGSEGAASAAVSWSRRPLRARCGPSWPPRASRGPHWGPGRTARCRPRAVGELGATRRAALEPWAMDETRGEEEGFTLDEWRWTTALQRGRSWRSGNRRPGERKPQGRERGMWVHTSRGGGWKRWAAWGELMPWKAGPMGSGDGKNRPLACAGWAARARARPWAEAWWAAGAPARWVEGGLSFPFLFSVLALISYWMHASQIHSTNKNRCMMRHDATTKRIISRVY